MAVLPDLGAAALYAAVVFLVALGMLVVFVETIGARRAAAVVGSLIGVAAILSWVGEPGMGLLALGLVGAVLANQAFEWLTTR